MTTPHSTIRIGTRGSMLAMWQANFVRELLLGKNKDVAVEILPIKTSGDIIQDVALARLEGKAFFTKEIEDALLARQIDIAVHSGKDVPTALSQGLVLGGFLKRHCPNDAWISLAGRHFLEIESGKTVGTSSLRRRALIAHLRPDLIVVDLRGNVDTRLRKLKEGRYDAIVLAAAGLERLDRLSEATELLEVASFPPAVSQGAVAVEIRSDDENAARWIADIVDEETTLAVTAERALLAALEGGCQVPLGAFAELQDDNSLELSASLLFQDGTKRIDACLTGPKSEPEVLGRRAAETLRDNGGDEILEKINRCRDDL